MQQYVIVNSKRNIIYTLEQNIDSGETPKIVSVIWDNYNKIYTTNTFYGWGNPEYPETGGLYYALSYYPAITIYNLLKTNNVYNSVLNVSPNEFNPAETCKKINLPFMTFGYIYNTNTPYDDTYVQPVYYMKHNISDFVYIDDYDEEIDDYYHLAVSSYITDENDEIRQSILRVIEATEYPDCCLQEVLGGYLSLERQFYYEFLGIEEENTSTNRIINILSLLKELLYRVHIYSDQNLSSYERTLYGIPYMEIEGSNTNNTRLKIAIPVLFNNNISNISNKYIRIETPKFIDYYLNMVTNTTPPVIVEQAPGIHNMTLLEDGTTLRIYIEKETSVLSKKLDITANYISILPVINMIAYGTFVDLDGNVHDEVLNKKHRYLLLDNNELCANVNINNYPYIDMSIVGNIPSNGTVKEISYANTLLLTEYGSEPFGLLLRNNISNLYSSSPSATKTQIFIPYISHIEIISQEDSRRPAEVDSSFFYLAEPYSTFSKPEDVEIITYDEFRYDLPDIEYARITTYIRDKYLQVYHPSWDTSWKLHKQTYIFGGVENITEHQIENHPLFYNYSLLNDFMNNTVRNVSETLLDTDTIFLESHKFKCLQDIYNPDNDPLQLHKVNSWFTFNRKMEIDFRRTIRSAYDPEDKHYVISISKYDFIYRPLLSSDIEQMENIQKEWQTKDFAYGIYYSDEDKISLDITIPTHVYDLSSNLNIDINAIPLADYKYMYFNPDFVTYQAPYFMAMLTNDARVSIGDTVNKEKMLEIGVTSTDSENYNEYRIDTGTYIRFRKTTSYIDEAFSSQGDIIAHSQYRAVDMNTNKSGFTGRTHLIENESITPGHRYFIGVWYTLYPWRGYLSYNPLPNTKLLTFVTATKDTSNITISVGNGEFNLGKQNTLNVESSTTSTRIVIYLLDKYNEPETYTKLYEITTTDTPFDLIDYIEQIYKDYNQQYTIDDTVQIPLLIDVIGNLGTEYVYSSVKLIVTFTLEGNLIYSKNVLVEGDDSNRRIYENKLYEMQAKTTTYPAGGSVTYNVTSENPVKAIAIEANTEEISGTIDFYIVIDNKKHKIVPLNTSQGLPNILFVSPPEEIESYLKANYGDNCIIKVDKLLYTFDIEVDFKTNNQYYTPELSLLKVLISSDLTSFMGG